MEATISVHTNPDESISDGIKSEPPGTFVAASYGVAVTASTALPGVAAAKTDGATIAYVQADGGSVRFRIDGTAPTATTGFLIPAGTVQPLNMADAATFLGIEASGATAVLNIWFSM
jgi:hypothetical protein